MSVESTLVGLVSATFGGRVFPDTAPADTARPFLIYQLIGGVPVNALCGDAIQQNVRVQFWVWADTRQAANEAMRAVAGIVSASPMRGTSLGGLITQYDEVTRSYGALQDFSFWA
jgi:hypothetical protein